MQNGVNAWLSGTVPSFITTNNFIARAYARVIAAFLRETFAGIESEECVYVIELGAGHGKFG